MRYPGTLRCSRPPFQRGRKAFASLVDLLGCKRPRLQMQIWRNHRSGVRAPEDFALLFHGRMQRQHPVKLPIEPGEPNRPLCRQRARPFSLAWLSHGSPPGGQAAPALARFARRWQEGVPVWLQLPALRRPEQGVLICLPGCRRQACRAIPSQMEA